MCAASSLHLTNCSHITKPRVALRHDTTESFRPDLVSHLFRWSWVLHCDFGEKKFGKLSVLGNLTCAQESWSPRFAWWMGTVYTRSSYWLILKTSQRAISIFGDPRAVSRVGRKGGTKVFKYGRKSPWVPTLTELFPKIQADAGSWLGTKNALYYCAQSEKQFLLSSFREFVHDGYCLATLARFVHQACTRKRNFYFLLSKPETKKLPMSRKTVWDAMSRISSICPENILFLTHHNIS